ncbi:MAG: hypothetical protein K2I96_04810 [Lachnospiraceae bacterium]|nr:hypothetical protein [Lachnospiraceae bacterium]
MTRDLWGVKDARDLEKSTKDMPDTILKEQIALLGKKTNFTVYGKPVFIKVNSREIEYKVATIFNVVVQALDNYEKTILIMYSNPETEYPVAITLGSSFEEDCELFNPKYVCNDKDSFESAVKEILSSERVLGVIQMLYSKAAMLAG